MKDELAITEGLPESSNKLATKNATEHVDGRKKRSRDLTQWGGFGTGAEQQIVEDFLILQGQWRELRRKCEDHMDVARSSVRGPRSDTSGNGDCGSCCRRWWHNARSGCIHRDNRRVRRCDSAQWPAPL